MIGVKKKAPETVFKAGKDESALVLRPGRSYQSQNSTPRRSRWHKDFRLIRRC